MFYNKETYNLREIIRFNVNLAQGVHIHFLTAGWGNFSPPPPTETQLIGELHYSSSFLPPTALSTLVMAESLTLDDVSIENFT